LAVSAQVVRVQLDGSREVSNCLIAFDRRWRPTRGHRRASLRQAGYTAVEVPLSIGRIKLNSLVVVSDRVIEYLSLLPEPSPGAVCVNVVRVQLDSSTQVSDEMVMLLLGPPSLPAMVVSFRGVRCKLN